MTSPPISFAEPFNWDTITRVTEPILRWPVTMSADPRPVAPSRIGRLTRESAVFVREPVTPHLLQLRTGDTDSLVEFIEAVGAVEVVRWAGGPSLSTIRPDLDPAAWEQLFRDVQDLHATLYRADLARAWENPDTVQAAQRDLTTVTELWGGAAKGNFPNAKVALKWALTAIQSEPDYPLRIEYAVTSQSRRLVERPRGMVARSLYELIVHLSEKAELPRLCEYCGNPFPQIRSDQRFCLKKHRGAAYRRDYDKTPYRREYQRRYRRVQRGLDPPEEFEAWKQQNRPQPA